MTRRDFLERLHELVDDFEIALIDEDEDLDEKIDPAGMITDFNAFVLSKLASDTNDEEHDEEESDGDDD